MHGSELKLIQEDQHFYYKYTSEPVLENNEYKLYLDAVCSQTNLLCIIDQITY